MNIYKVKEILDNNYETEININYKGGVSKQGIVVHKGVISPMFYPETFNGTDAEIAMEIIQMVEKMVSPNLNISDLTNWDKAKEIVYTGIRPVTNDTRNFTERFLDLEIYYYLRISPDLITKVTKQIITDWGITVETLRKTARENTCRDAMFSTMSEEMASFGVPFPPFMPDQVIIKNTDSRFGAGAIVYKDLLDAAARKLRTDKVFVMPSSIHELIIMDAEFMSKREADEMVSAANEEAVSPEDRLADHAYIYDASTMELTK